jgi:hypothetical protein
MTASRPLAIAAADDELAVTLTELQEIAQPILEDPSAPPPDGSSAVLSRTFEWVGANCDVEVLDVTAVDYGFEGAPGDAPAGYTVVDFENAGTEQHEMAVIRIGDGVTESLDELLALPEEESQGKLSFVGAAFASAGTSSAAGLDLSAPGRYAMVCLIPVGSVGDARGDGPPHVVEGMVHEFTVSS